MCRRHEGEIRSGTERWEAWDLNLNRNQNKVLKFNPQIFRDFKSTMIHFSWALKKVRLYGSEMVNAHI